MSIARSPIHPRPPAATAEPAENPARQLARARHVCHAQRLLLAFGLAAAASAQGTTASEAVLRGFDLRVPIHGRAGDPDYGVWAAGATFKASFHDGFSFHPALRPDEAGSLPLRLTFLGAARDGAHGVAGLPPAPTGRAPTLWRYEYEHAGVTEAYDVREDGIEQSFVLAQAPAGIGELVVRVGVDSVLGATVRSPAHAALTFRDASGTERVRYGAAVAFDRHGSRIAVPTSFDGACIGLHVDGAWLASAAYPVTIDPLLGTVAQSLGNARPVRSTDVGSEAVSASKRLMVALAYAYSATDIDLRVYLADSDFGNATLVFADTSTLVTDWPRLAYVHGANRWIVVYEHGQSGATPQIRRYTHPRGNTTLNAGGAPVLVAAAGRHPDVGGVHAPATSQRAYVVWEADAAGTTQYTDIHGYVVDVITDLKWLANPAGLPSGTTYDRNLPSVCQGITGNGEGWVTAWSRIEHATGRTSIWVNKMAQDGGAYSSSWMHRPGADQTGYLRGVHVDGAAGRYLLAYVRGSQPAGQDGDQIHVVRFDWNPASSVATQVTSRIHTAAAAGNVLREPCVAYDRTSRSHWAVAHVDADAGGGSTVPLRRVGFTGGTVESRVLNGGQGEARDLAPAVTFDAVARTFPASFATAAPDGIVAVDRLAYPSAAASTPYGTGCGGIVSSNRPDAGFEFFAVRLDAAGATAAALMLSPVATSVPLDALGMPGCTLRVGPDPLLTVPVAVVQGHAELGLPLRDAPVLIGDVQCQWLQLVPGANAIGVLTTPGLSVHVR